MSSSSKSLKIAVLLTFPAQLLDLSGIDLFGMMSKEYMSDALPKPMSDAALDVEIFYIGRDDSPSTSAQQVNLPETSPPPQQHSGQEGIKLTELTAQAHLKADLSVHSESVQPAKIDILLIPGPPPTMKMTSSTLEFVRAHHSYGTTILCVCTGCFVAAQAGILDGRKASAPRGLAPRLRKEYPQVTWDDQRRFVKDAKPVNQRDGEVWTSGGITNGLEMIAAFLREEFPGPVSEAVCAMADVGDKGEFYDTSVSVDTAWWIGQILRALLFGKRKSKRSR